MSILQARFKQPLRLFLGITIITLTLYAGWIIHSASYQSTKKHLTALVTPPAIAPTHTIGTRKTVNAGMPMRLIIPKIGVNAALEAVGLTPDGNLDTPKDPADAAWYDQGPRPGDSGDAVIDGHFGYVNRVPTVFNKLQLLQPGDSIYVENENGATVAFIVRALQTYNPNEDVPAVFSPDDGGEHLNLITCHGDWNGDQQTYDARLVVFADKQIPTSAD